MSREIKFRVWDKDSKKMRLMDSYHDSLTFGKGYATYYNLQNGDGNGFEDSGYGALMQYTGLEDKNGVQIYEGDILKCIDEHTTIGTLEYADNIGTYIVKYFRKGNYYYSPLNRGDISRGLQLLETEVIGNVYETPELLEV